jgi:hypothetical protein
MKTLLATLALLALATTPHLRAADTALEATATKTMLPWLELIDAADYSASYDEASATFRESLTKNQWIAALENARTPLGTLNSREIATASALTVLPDGTRGDFLLAQFNSVFEKLPAATETVTFEKGADGEYRAGGYYIRPGAATTD